MVKAKEVMNTSVISIRRDEDICEAIRLMTLNHITGLPVVNADGTLAGIISRRDIIKHIRELKCEDRALRDSILELVF